MVAIVDEAVQPLMEKIATLEEQLGEVKEKSNDDNNDIIAIVDEAIKPLKESISILEEQLQEVKEKSNDNKQYSRRSNIGIFGLKSDITCGSTEDCTKVAVDFCKEELDVQVKSSEIDKAHRIGQQNGDQPRAMIVKFKSHASKIKVVNARKKLKGDIILRI